MISFTPADQVSMQKQLLLCLVSHQFVLACWEKPQGGVCPHFREEWPTS